MSYRALPLPGSLLAMWELDVKPGVMENSISHPSTLHIDQLLSVKARSSETRLSLSSHL